LDDKGNLVTSMNLKEKKTGKKKAFPLNKIIRETLKIYLTSLQTTDDFRDSDSPLFPSREGGPITRQRAHQILSQAGQEVGLGNIGTHSLRKTFGFHLVIFCTKSF